MSRTTALAETQGRKDEPELTAESFEFVRKLIYEHAGIVLEPHKMNMVQRRLKKRLQERELATFEDYCRYLEGPEAPQEIGFTLNALTTNETRLYREKHHFEHLAQTVLPSVAAATPSGVSPRLRIWSAGCSSGEEPHTIAITLCQALKDLKRWDAKILATDIDTDMVAAGRAGVYEDRFMKEVSAPVRKSFFQPVPGQSGHLKANDAVRQLITFKQLNLLGPWPMKGPFDVIFCRNVVIYFDKPTQRQLFARYAEILKDGGHLYIGHSESLHNVSDRFKPLGQSIYQKVP